MDIDMVDSSHLHLSLGWLPVCIYLHHRQHLHTMYSRSGVIERFGLERTQFTEHLFEKCTQWDDFFQCLMVTRQVEIKDKEK